MNFEFSNNLKYFQTGIFNVLNDKKAELIKQGKKVYNLSVGTPDFEPDEHVKQALIDCAKNSENWKYSLDDMPELIDALISYYKNRFNVNLNSDEIMSVYGSQEGLTHIGFSLCNKDDIVLVPNPGYPIFEIGPYLSGAEIAYYPLLPENNYLPDLDKIDEDILKRTKFMVVSYPMNPVCATAPLEFYDELIVFAKKHNIIIIHDNAYSDIVYDEKCGGSFLSHEGAKEVGVEFYSLSKSFNITGARVSFVVGNSEQTGSAYINTQVTQAHFLTIFNRQIITYLQVIQTQIVTILHKTGGSTRVLIRVTRHGTWNISIRIFRCPSIQGILTIVEHMVHTLQLIFSIVITLSTKVTVEIGYQVKVFISQVNVESQ